MNEKPFFDYAIQPAQALDPHQAVLARGEKSLFKPIFQLLGSDLSLPSVGFAAERKYQTCATQEENGSLQLSS